MQISKKIATKHIFIRPNQICSHLICSDLICSLPTLKTPQPKSIQIPIIFNNHLYLCSSKGRIDQCSLSSGDYGTLYNNCERDAVSMQGGSELAYDERGPYAMNRCGHVHHPALAPLSLRGHDRTRAADATTFTCLVFCL